MIRAQRTHNGKTSCETRYFITSLPPDARQLAEAVRAHWGIENQLHWVLDMIFRDDESRIRKGHAPQNATILKHMALNLLKKTKSRNSIRVKRKAAGWDKRWSSPYNRRHRLRTGSALIAEREGPIGSLTWSARSSRTPTSPLGSGGFYRAAVVVAASVLIKRSKLGMITNLFLFLKCIFRDFMQRPVTSVPSDTNPTRTVCIMASAISNVRIA